MRNMDKREAKELCAAPNPLKMQRRLKWKWYCLNWSNASYEHKGMWTVFVFSFQNVISPCIYRSHTWESQNECSCIINENWFKQHYYTQEVSCPYEIIIQKNHQENTYIKGCHSLWDIPNFSQWMGFPVALVIKNLCADAGDIGDLGLIPGLERSAWRIPWTEEP